MRAENLLKLFSCIRTVRCFKNIAGSIRYDFWHKEVMVHCSLGSRPKDSEVKPVTVRVSIQTLNMNTIDRLYFRFYRSVVVLYAVVRKFSLVEFKYNYHFAATTVSGPELLTSRKSDRTGLIKEDSF